MNWEKCDNIHRLRARVIELEEENAAILRNEKCAMETVKRFSPGEDFSCTQEAIFTFADRARAAKGNIMYLAREILKKDRGTKLAQIAKGLLDEYDPPPKFDKLSFDNDGAIVYECGGCGSRDVKLWRDYQTFLDNQTLACQTCAEHEQRKELGAECDQIGWRIPAVPDGTGTFWGYSSVPQPRVEWWKSLPDKSK